MKHVMKKRLKKGLALTTAVLCMAGLVSCGSSTAQEEVPELLEPVGVALTTETVAKGEFVNYVSYVGNVTPSVSELYFETDGTIETLYVYQGEYVEEGDPLIALDQESIQNKIDSIQDNIDYLTQNGAYEDQIANLNIQYLQVELGEIGEAEGTDSSDYQLKQLEIESAVKSRDQAAQTRNTQIASYNEQKSELSSKLQEQTLYAPHAGHVWFADTVTEGSSVRALRTIIYITDPADLTFVVNEAVSDIILDSGSYYAQIDGKEWEVDYQELSEDEKLAYLSAGQTPPENFTFRDASFADELTAGMTGALIGETVHLYDVITVPCESIMRENNQDYVYVIEDGLKVKRDVTQGRNNGLRAVITEGLEEGDVIYVPDL